MYSHAEIISFVAKVCQGMQPMSGMCAMQIILTQTEAIDINPIPNYLCNCNSFNERVLPLCMF